MYVDFQGTISVLTVFMVLALMILKYCHILALNYKCYEIAFIHEICQLIVPQQLFIYNTRILQ